MKHFVGCCLFSLALSILALAFGVIKVKIKVCFWFKEYPEFRVGFVWKPGVCVEAAEKPSKET